MPSGRRPYRVLQIAEAANPEWASVPLEGWSLSRALAKISDAHLITHVRNRDAILRAGLTEGREFSTIDNEQIAAPLYKLSDRLRGGAGKGWTTITAFSALAYYAFERELWRQFGGRIAAREFDIVHRITPISPTHQSIIARRLAKLGVPFVLGPLNGGIPWPKNFRDRRRAEREWLSQIRSLYKFLPAYRSTRRDSSAIIAGSKYTYSEIPDWAKDKSVYIPENGVDIERFKIPRSRRAALPIKAAFVGRLVPYKGADILLEAAAEYLRSGQIELDVVGDGPERPLLAKTVDQLGIQHNVRFHGWLAHIDVQGILRECDFLALPSVREFGGAVVVEAMALGVTPVVANYGGPSEHVDESTGIRVDFTDKQSLVDGMRHAIGDLIRSPELLDRFGSAGREKALQNLTWDAKARQIAAVYDSVYNATLKAGPGGRR